MCLRPTRTDSPHRGHWARSRDLSGLHDWGRAVLLPASSGWGPGRLLNVLQDTAPAARTDRLPSVRNSMPGAQPYKLCGSPVAVRGCSVALMSWVSRPGEPGFEPRLLGRASVPR